MCTCAYTLGWELNPPMSATDVDLTVQAASFSVVNGIGGVLAAPKLQVYLFKVKATGIIDSFIEALNFYKAAVRPTSSTLGLNSASLMVGLASVVVSLQPTVPRALG